MSVLIKNPITIVSGGSVLIEYGVIGTLVPNTGTIEKVYLNNALSDAEVESLLSQLTYTRNGEYYVAITDTYGLVGIGLAGMYAIMDLNRNIIWCNEAVFNQMGSQFGLTHSGWQDFTNPVEINAEALSDIEGILVGSKNDLLTSLFSTTPFEKATKKLTGTYDGRDVEIKEGYVSTVVPNTGTVEKVYVNTDLSVAEVEALLSQLTYGSNKPYFVVQTDTTGLLCVGMNGMYGIMDLNNNPIWCNEAFFNNIGSDFNLTHSGWQEFTNPIEINAEVDSRGGLQNDLLVSLFSITPISYNPFNGTVNLEEFLDKQKIPLNIKVPKVLIEYDVQGAVVPNSGYVEKVYLNTSLSDSEVENLLSKLTYYDGRNENIIVTEDNQKSIYCYNRKNLYRISLYNNGNNILLWDNSNGWQDFTNPIEINSNVVSTTEWGAVVGTQNESLINLFSTTEKATKTLNGTYDGREITIKSGWNGTAIPNTGTIQNIYANTNLSFDEVLTELNKLTYVYQQAETSLDENKRGFYSVVNIPELDLEIFIQVSKGEALIALSDFSLLIFATAGTDVGFVGWNTDLVANGGKIPLVSAAPVSEGDEDAPSYEVIPESYHFNGSSGAENSKITGLFSTTPFVYSEFDGVINLEEYIDNKKIPLNIKVDTGSNNGANNGAEVTLGNAVPNSGYVEKVYFNTALTIEEVVAELDKLTYTEISYAETSLEGATNHWNCLLTTSSTDIFVIVRDGQIAIVEDYSGETLFSNTGGWNPDFSGEIEVNSNASDYYQETVAGVENYKITKLFSSTPEFSEEYAKKLTGTYDGTGITVTENGNVDILEAINNKQIPLNINVNVTPEVKVDDKVLTEQNYDGTAIEVTENGTVDISALIDEKKIPLSINVDIPDVTVDEKVLVGNYDGTAIEVTENGTVDINALLDEKKLPLSIEVKDVVSNATITAILNKDY